MMIFQTEEREARTADVLRLARAALGTYASTAGELPVELRGAFTGARRFQSGRHRGWVLWNDDDVIVAFRGNDDERQWMETMAYGQVPWVAGKAHGGLVRVLEELWTPVVGALYDADGLEKSLHVTGHSLGGGLAALAAQRLYHEGWSPELVATFGAPPVLDTAACDAFETPFVRVVNNRDAVPGIIWPSMTDRYAHAGEEWFLGASGRLHAKRYSHHLARRIDRAWSIGEGVMPDGPLHDHGMDAYVEKLKGLVDSAED